MNRISAFHRFTTLSICMMMAVISAHAASQKPHVAIKTPAVGEGVKDYANRYLNRETLLSEMEASLLATRKFDVLSRKKSTMSAVREEQKFSKSDYASGNAAKEGQLSSANFLLIPVVQDFKFYRISKSVPNMDDKYTRQDFGMLEVAVQIIDTTTNSIKTTFYMKDSFSTAKQVVNKKGGAPSSVHFTKLSKKVAAQMADQLVDIVFPMKVLSRKNKQVFINRGKDGGLKVGSVLNVYEPGEQLIDPDTGESLGATEEFAGKIKVVRINPKFTIAEIKSESMPIEKGSIVRKP